MKVHSRKLLFFLVFDELINCLFSQVNVTVSELFPIFALATIENVQDNNGKPVIGRLHASELADEPAHDSAAMTG